MPVILVEKVDKVFTHIRNKRLMGVTSKWGSDLFLRNIVLGKSEADTEI